MIEQIQQMKKFWVMVSAYYQRQLDSHVLQMYGEDCKDVTFEELKWAFEQWRRGARGGLMPLPMQLVNLIRPEPDLNAEANETAGRIREAISRFGYTQGQAARDFIGEVGWSAVQGFGGWVALCESQDEPAKWAQIRELAKSKMIRAAQGRTDVVPGLGLPGVPDRPQIDHSAQNSLNSGVSNVSSLVSTALKGKELK